MKQLEEILKQINRLIIGERHKFIEQIGQGDNAHYVTTTFFKLTDKEVREHIEGDRTIGCFYCGKGSKFLCFDIDDTEPVKTIGIINTLQRIGIKKEYIHVEDSGNKGYHVWIFFDEPLPNLKLVSFGKWVISQLGEYQDKVELRPESENGKAVKLPLGIHRKTGKRTNFITHQLGKINNTYEYFLSIEPMNMEEMNHIIDEALTILDVRTLERKPPEDLNKRLEESKIEFKDIKPPINQSSSLRQLAIRLLNDGIRDEDLEKGKGRHSLQFFVILYLKEEGNSEGETCDKVIEWALREKRKGMVESDEKKIRSDVKRNVKQIYKYDMGLFDSQGKPFELYKSDLIVAGSYKLKTTQKVVLAILLLGRIFHENGEYYFSYRQIAQMSGVSLRTTQKIIPELVKEGSLELINKGTFAGRKASIYRIPYLLEESEKVEIKTNEIDSYKGLFDSMYSHLIKIPS